MRGRWSRELCCAVLAHRRTAHWKPEREERECCCAMRRVPHDGAAGRSPGGAAARESEWNARNLFTGWVNVGLTTTGEQQAGQAGKVLARHELLPGFVHTSLQRRTVRTADLALAECDRDWIAVRRSWRVNSNHYGALQGRNKDEVLAEFGERHMTGAGPMT